MISSLALTPDEQTLIVGTDAGRVHFLGVRSSKERCRFGSLGGYAMVAVSPDGRTVAVSATDKYNDGFSPIGRELALEKPERMIVVLETATGKERFRLLGHQSGVSSLAFAADGKTLASGSLDSTAMAWNVTYQRSAGPNKHPDRKELEALWQDLASDNAERAFMAIQALAAVPEASVPFLRTKLEPVSREVPQDVADLLLRLESEKTDVRQQAAADLARLGEAAEVALRRTLLNKPTLELRLRIEALLDKVEITALSAKRVRALRSIEVLEAIGTKDVRPLLSALAEGAPEAQQTTEARTTLKRLPMTGK